MKRIYLSDQLSLSAITQGFWRLSSWQWSSDELTQFMNDCIKLGVTSFDTAELYGRYTCEKEIGEALKKDPTLRSRIEIITKTGINKPANMNEYTMNHYDTSYQKIISSCEKSLKNLGIKQIDLYLIHREDPFMNIYEIAKAFKEIKDKGWVKEVGVSNFNPIQFDALQKACEGSLVCNQIECSPLEFEHFNNNNLDYLQAQKVHPMFYSPLAGGRIFTSNDEDAQNARLVLNQLAQKYECDVDTLVFAWLLKHPVNGIAISGSSKISRLENAVKAVDLDISLEDWYRIYLASGQQVLR